MESECTWKTYLKAGLNLIIFVVGLVLACVLLPKLLSLFMPFLIGWIVACIGSPLARFLESRIRMKRKIGSAVIIILVIAGVLLFCYGIGWWLAGQFFGLLKELPNLWASFVESAHNLEQTDSVIARFMPADITEFLNSLETGLLDYVADVLANIGTNTQTMSAMSDMAGKVPQFIVGVFMSVLSAYFFIADKESIIEECRKHLPKVVLEQAGHVWHGLGGIVGGYIKAQIKIEVWIYLLLMTGLLILQVDFAVVIALGIAAIDILPVFGSGFILWPWAVIAAVGGNYRLTIGLVILWGLGQAVRQLIQPKIVGDSLGLAPFPTLVLIYIGYLAGGFLGMILAVPIGILVINMYQEGVFKNTVDSVRILFQGLNRFRKFTPKELGEEERKVEHDAADET